MLAAWRMETIEVEAWVWLDMIEPPSGCFKQNVKYLQKKFSTINKCGPIWHPDLKGHTVHRFITGGGSCWWSRWWTYPLGLATFSDWGVWIQTRGAKNDKERFVCETPQVWCGPRFFVGCFWLQVWSDPIFAIYPTKAKPSRACHLQLQWSQTRSRCNGKYTKHIQKHSKKVNSYVWLSRQKRSTKHSIRGTFCKVCCGTSSPPFQRLSLGCKNSEIVWCGDVVFYIRTIMKVKQK